MQHFTRLLLLASLSTTGFALFMPRQDAGSCTDGTVVSNTTVTIAGNEFQIQTISCRSTSAPSRRQLTAPPFAQCGGLGFTGPTECTEGTQCIVLNPDVSQCLPPGASDIPTVSNPEITPTPTTNVSISSPPPSKIVETVTEFIPTTSIIVSIEPTTVTDLVTVNRTVTQAVVVPTTVTEVTVQNRTLTAISVKPTTVTAISVEESFVTVVSVQPTTVTQVSTLVVTASAAPTPPPSGPSTGVCNELCSNTCGSIGDLPPISEDCGTIFNAIALLNGELPPTFDVPSNHIEQLTFGTCRVFFENFSPDTITYCWTALSEQASVAASACFPPVQPVNSLGLCTASDGAWEVGIAHS